MTGLQMMLKSFGIEFDPEQVKAQVIAFQAQLSATLQNFDNRLVAIEQNQLVMLESLKLILDYVGSDTRPAGEGAVTTLLLEQQNGPNGSN